MLNKIKIKLNIVKSKSYYVKEFLFIYFLLRYGLANEIDDYKKVKKNFVCVGNFYL